MRSKVKTALGIRQSGWRSLPIKIRNAERGEQLLRSVLFYVLAGSDSENMRQQLRFAAAVIENGARLARHRAVDSELHPVRARLDQASGVVWIGIWQVFAPIKAAGHGQQVADCDAPLAIIYI